MPSYQLTLSGARFNHLKELMAEPKIALGIILKDGKKVLLGQRRMAPGAESWAFPGGLLEFGESPLTCAKRELIEETGLTASVFTQGPYTNDVFERDNKHFVTLHVIAKYEGGTPNLRQPEKFKELKWFSWDQLPSPLHSSIQNLKRLGFVLPA